MDLSVLARTSGRRLVPVGLALGSALLVLVLARVGFLPISILLQRFELKTVDYRFRKRGARPPSTDVVIVTVDEATTRRLGCWPCSRQVSADLINVLHEAGAKAIGFDIFFTDPNAADPEGDRALAEATRRAGNVVHALYEHRREDKTLTSAELAALDRHAWRPTIHGGGTLPTFEGLSPPLVPIAEASAGLGFANLPVSPDGVFRTALFLAGCEGRVYPSLALALAAEVLGVDSSEVRVEGGQFIDLGGKRRIPINRHGYTVINFAGPGNTFPFVSLADVVLDGPNRPARLREQFAGKIVLVGATAPGLYDLRPNPFSPVFFGVEDQANGLANILDNRFLHEVRGSGDALVVVLLALLIGLVAPRLSPLAGAVAGAAILAGYDYAAVWLFAHRSIIVGMVSQNLAVGLAYVAALVYRLATGERERARLRASFGRYVPPQVVEALLATSGTAGLGGERRPVTVLFTDIRDFTPMSEHLQPEDVVALLNRYFTLMHEVIWKFEGTLDKYMGDAIMAVWNAPSDQPDHAQRAVQAALEMQRQVRLHQDEWAFQGVPELRVGMGLHTGEAVAGNVGSDLRMQYTVIGDDVNLAWRLQELTKTYDVPILASAATYEACRGLVEGEQVDTVQVRGRSAPVAIYAIRSSSEEANANGGTRPDRSGR